MKIIKQLRTFRMDMQGVTALEYGLIAALVAVVAIGGFQILGTNLSATINTVSQSL
jgi:pilus assembly protein Flp/PilA